MIDKKQNTVLVIDDDAESAKWFKELFEAENERVFIVNDCNLALSTVDRIKPDLIIIDLHMEPENGFELSIQIKLKDELKYIPIILVSGSSNDLDNYKAFLVGVSGMIERPLNKAKVINEIKIPQVIYQMQNLAKSMVGVYGCKPL